MALDSRRDVRCSQGLWADKLCNPTQDLAVRGQLSWREAYVESLEDAKRTQISTEELCRMEWTFNFKHTAGLGFVQRPVVHNGLHNGLPLRVPSTCWHSTSLN